MAFTRAFNSIKGLNLGGINTKNINLNTAKKVSSNIVEKVKKKQFRYKNNLNTDMQYGGMYGRRYRRRYEGIDDNVSKANPTGIGHAKPKGEWLGNGWKKVKNTLDPRADYANSTGALNFAKNYYFGNGFKKGAARVGATLGTLDAAGNILGGGNLFEDGKGRRDIAGIPFI